MLTNFKSKSLLLSCALYSSLTFANYTSLTQWIQIQPVTFGKITYHFYNLDHSFIKNNNASGYKLSSTPFPYDGPNKVEGIKGNITINIVRNAVCSAEVNIPFFEKDGLLITPEQTYHMELWDGGDNRNCTRRNKVAVMVEKNADPNQGYIIDMEDVG